MAQKKKRTPGRPKAGNDKLTHTIQVRLREADYNLLRRVAFGNEQAPVEWARQVLLDAVAKGAKRLGLSGS